MKPKQLVPLAIVLALLAGLVLLRQSGRDTPSLTEQVKLTSLLPEDLDRADIAKIEIHAGAKADEAVVLARESSGEGWIVSSHFDAPVKADKIEKFLDNLTRLKGEFRASTASGEGLSAYDLEEETGFHVKGFSEGPEELLFHLVTGKAPDYGNAFARAADGEDVYVIDVNLRREAGIYTVELSDSPAPGIWLDKQVLDLEQDKIKAISLIYPDKELAFEYRLIEQPEEEPGEEPGEEPEEDSEEDAKPVVPAAPQPPVEEYAWVVASGGTGEDLNATALTNLTRRLANLSASDIVDPSKTTDWKLDAPDHICRIRLDGQDEEIVLELGRPEEERYGYLRLSNAKKNIVYKINGYDVEQIFAEGGTYFELPGILVDEEDVDRIEYSTDEGSVVLSRIEDIWSVVEPSADVAVVQYKLNTLARTLLSWKASDYADGSEGTGLDGEAKSVKFSGEGFAHTIAVGAKAASRKGYYARLDRLDQVLVMSERDHANIFVTPSELFDRDVLDLDEADITWVEIIRGEQVLTLEEGDEGWTVAAGVDEVHEADEDAAADLRLALSGLSAEKLLFEGGATGEMLGSVVLTSDDGEEYRLNVHSEEAGLHAVTLPGRETGYWIAAADVERLFPDLDALRKADAPEEDAAVEELPAEEASEDASTEEP